MIEVLLGDLGGEIAEAVLQRWFFEEGDAVNEGDDLVELSSENGTFIIQTPAAGVVTEVYYDEGETVQKGEVLCVVDNEDDAPTRAADE